MCVRVCAGVGESCFKDIYLEMSAFDRLLCFILLMYCHSLCGCAVHAIFLHFNEYDNHNHLCSSCYYSFTQTYIHDK